MRLPPHDPASYAAVTDEDRRVAMKLAPGTGVDVGILARDPAVLCAFYGDFLGFELVRELDWPDVGSHVWFYRCGDSHVKVCGRTAVPAAANPTGGHTAATGLRYLAFVVESVDDVLVGLEESGGHLLRAPFVADDARVAFFEDPEGNVIEVIERRPGSEG